jgi:hypothetical protein
MSRPQYHGRRQPYTAIGIARLPCSVRGCSNKAHASWQACANGRRHTPLCLEHDIAMNRMVLEFVGFENVEELMAAYEGAV